VFTTLTFSTFASHPLHDLRRDLRHLAVPARSSPFALYGCLASLSGPFRNAITDGSPYLLFPSFPSPLQNTLKFRISRFASPLQSCSFADDPFFFFFFFFSPLSCSGYVYFFFHRPKNPSMLACRLVAKRSPSTHLDTNDDGLFLQVTFCLFFSPRPSALYAY